jgi:hypothetical protein
MSAGEWGMLGKAGKLRAVAGALAALAFVWLAQATASVDAQPGGAQGTTRHKVVGNIFVDIEGGAYPSGYAPAWDLGQNLTYIEMAFEDRVVANQLSATDRMNITIADSSGTAMVAFESAIGQLCVADITGNTAPWCWALRGARSSSPTSTSTTSPAPNAHA